MHTNSEFETEVGSKNEEVIQEELIEDEQAEASDSERPLNRDDVPGTPEVHEQNGATPHQLRTGATPDQIRNGATPRIYTMFRSDRSYVQRAG